MDGDRRPNSSKVDFVKVRVWLSRRHYYVLSRFLVDTVDALQVALELKKTLVDREALDVTQAAMEQLLFHILQQHGYGADTIRLYHMMSSFHHQRIPLVILIGGTACVGKSSIATQLAERLNLPSVLQTELTAELMQSMQGPAAAPVPLRRALDAVDSRESLLARFAAECALVKRGLQPDLDKCLREGKSLIVEGLHVTSELYRGLEGVDRGEPPDASDAHSTAPAPPTMVTHWPPADQADTGPAPMVEVPTATTAAAPTEHASPVRAIILPFLLVINDVAEHARLLDDWLQRQPPGAHTGSRELHWARALQEHLEADARETGAEVTALSSSATISAALEHLHGVVLERLVRVFDGANWGP